MEKITMDDYSKELESSFKPLKTGDIIEGTIIGMSDTEVYVDLNYYTEGVIRAEDYSAEPGFSIKAHVNIGDVISATILRMDDGQGNILLSKTLFLTYDSINLKNLYSCFEFKKYLLSNSRK